MSDDNETPRGTAVDPWRAGGGPAFPSHSTYGRHYGGMTLRDWFAGQAMMMIGLANKPVPASERDDPAGFAARMAYVLADAMLKAREKSE